MRFLAHDWAVSTGSGFRLGFDRFEFGGFQFDRFQFGGFPFDRFQFGGFRFDRFGRFVVFLLRGGRFDRFRKLSAGATGFFGIRPVLRLGGTRADGSAPGPEDGVVARRHLDEDDRPQQGEAEDGDGDHAGAEDPDAPAPGGQAPLRLAHPHLLLGRVHDGNAAWGPIERLSA